MYHLKNESQLKVQLTYYLQFIFNFSLRILRPKNCDDRVQQDEDCILMLYLGFKWMLINR